MKIATPRTLPRFSTTREMFLLRMTRYWYHEQSNTNSPIFGTQNIIKGYVNNDDQFARKTTIPEDKFLDLDNLVLTTTWHTFNSQFYQQTDRFAVGGPASSTTAEVYMQTHERTAISTVIYNILQKFGSNLLMTFVLFLNVHTWTIFFITSTIFIKILSLLRTKKVIENLHFLTLC